MAAPTEGCNRCTCVASARVAKTVCGSGCEAAFSADYYVVYCKQQLMTFLDPRLQLLEEISRVMHCHPDRAGDAVHASCADLCRYCLLCCPALCPSSRGPLTSPPSVTPLRPRRACDCVKRASGWSVVGHGWSVTGQPGSVAECCCQLGRTGMSLLMRFVGAT